MVDKVQGEEAEKVTFKDYGRVFKGNKALQMLVVAASTNKFASNAISSLAVLFYFYVADDPSMQGTVAMVTMIGTLAAIYVGVKLTSKLGRRDSMLYMSIGATLWGVIAVLLIGAFGIGVGFGVVALIMFVNTILNTSTQLNIIPMIADCADYEVHNGGKFMPGMIGTSFSFIDKMISSFGTWSTGILLVALGYESMEATPLSNTMFWGILAFYFLIPSLGHLASVFAMKKYPITQEYYDEMVKNRVDVVIESDVLSDEY